MNSDRNTGAVVSALRAIGARIRVHDLRHVFVSHFVTGGGDI